MHASACTRTCLCFRENGGVCELSCIVAYVHAVCKFMCEAIEITQGHSIKKS